MKGYIVSTLARNRIGFPTKERPFIRRMGYPVKILEVNLYIVLERVLRRLLVPIFITFVGQLDAREQNLFVVDVKIEDQTTGVEQAATRTSLLEVISRLTGLESVPRTAEIKKALDQAESFVSEYMYTEVPNFDSKTSAASKPLSVLRIVFQPDQIDSLLRLAKLPRWPSPRDTCIVWALLENDGRRKSIVPGETFGLAELLAANSLARGLPLIFPVMDLEDQLAVKHGLIWGRFGKELLQASERYNANCLLIGRLVAHETGTAPSFSGDWTIKSRNSVSYHREAFSTEDGVKIAKETIGSAVDLITESSVIYAGESYVYRLRVRLIEDFKDYLAVNQYLSKSPYVEDFSVDGYEGGFLKISIKSMAGRERLMELFEKEGKLANDDTTWKTSSELEYFTFRWKEDV